MKMSLPGERPLGLRESDIGLVRVGDADGQMEEAVGVPSVDHIGTFRSTAVALELLVTDRREAQSDRIGPQHAIGAVGNQQALRLVEAQPGDLGSGIGSELAAQPDRSAASPPSKTMRRGI